MAFVALATAGVAALSACGPTQLNGSTQQAPTQPASGSATAKPANGGGPSGGNSGATQPCGPDSLTKVAFQSAEYSDENEGDGFVQVVNTGAQPCTMSGYPQLQLMSANVDLHVNVQTVLDPGPSDFVLKPNGYAGFALQWTPGPQPETGYPLALNVTPPANSGLITAFPNKDDKTPMKVGENGTVKVSAWKQDQEPIGS